MAITSILRDWSDGVSIVRIVSTDTLAIVGATGYITAQAANIASLNSGTIDEPFDWLVTDTILVAASDGWALYTISPDFSSLNPMISSQAPLLTAQATLTSAQFLGMFAAPVLLLPAPGANKLIIVRGMQLVMTFGSVVYAGGGVVAAQYDSTVNGAGVKATNTEAAADFFAGASTTFNFSTSSGNTVGALPFSTTVNKGIYLSNATGAFTGGNSPFAVKLSYQVIPTV